MKYAVGACVLVLFALLPFLASSEYALNVAIVAFAFVVLAVGLNLIYGYTGLLSFAQVGLWGVGAYAAALLAVDLGLSPWLAFLLGGAIAAVVALAIGYPALRLSRHAFSMVTLAFTLLLQLLATDWQSLTRGPMGIPGLPIPVLRWGGQVLRFDDPRSYYYLMLVFTVLAVALVGRVVHSRIGRTLVAIREDEALAESQGVNTMAYKLLAFACAGFLSGVAGGLFVFHLTLVDPTIFSFYYTEAVLIMVIVGGAGTFWEVVLAALVFTLVPELLRASTNLRLVIYGALLVAVMMMLPEGIGGYFRGRRLERRRRELAAAPPSEVRAA